MGWWSPTILGGDEPMDFVAWIGDRVFARIGHDRVAGLLSRAGQPLDVANERPDGHLIWPPAPERSELHHAVRKALGMVAASLAAEFAEAADGGRFGLQALAVVLMGYGAPMSAEMRRVCGQAAFGDEWARADARRRRHVAQLVAAINGYRDGAPTRIEEVGLFEAIERHIAAGRPGPVNTGPDFP
jgi:hypothetical protein